MQVHKETGVMEHKEKHNKHLILPMLPKFPRGVLLRSSLNNLHEPSAQLSRILSRVRDPFLKLQIEGKLILNVEKRILH
jgi:hypothetical protein